MGRVREMEEQGEEGRTAREKKEMGRELEAERRIDLAVRLFPRPQFSHFTTTRQNLLKNPDFRTSGKRRGCFAVYIAPLLLVLVLIALFPEETRKCSNNSIGCFCTLVYL